MKITFDFKDSSTIQNGSIEDFCLMNKNEIEESILAHLKKRESEVEKGTVISLGKHSLASNDSSKGFQINIEHVLSFEVTSVVGTEITLSLKK